LYNLFINPKSYNDKKLNTNYEKDNAEKIKGILKTQETKIFKTVTNIDLSNDYLLNKKSILNTSDSIASISNQNDIYFMFLSGIFIKNYENKIFYISQIASFKNITPELIDLNELTNTFLKTKSFASIFINASHSLQNMPEGYSKVNEQEIYNYVSKNLVSSKEKAIFVIDNPENTQFFDVLANSLHPSNDKDNNNVIDFDEIIGFITQLYNLHYSYSGKYLPIFLHGNLK